MPSLFVDQRLAQRSLLEVLQTGFRLSRKGSIDALKKRQVKICGGVCLDPQRRVQPGQHIQYEPRSAKPKNANNAHGIVVRYADDAIVVVEKPAGMTTVRHADEIAALGPRARKHLPPTLVDLLPGVLARAGGPSRQRIRAVHRLDKETSGLVVLARTSQTESYLGKQFRAHTTGRRYLALVRGQAKDARIESQFVPDRGDGRRGSQQGVRGQHAVTHIRVLEAFGDFSLVECELETGRTHQVRIHLGEAGTPLCGEHIYDRPLHGRPLPDGSDAKRPMLHAAYLAIDHPSTGKRMEWRAEIPDDMKDLLYSFSARGAPRKC
jgi:23S rRNA pseudouridine1911/1915/1917 synthase